MTESERISSRVRFNSNVEKLLKGKPKRYQDIIQGMIERYQEYYTIVGSEFYDVERVIDFCVDLDQEYVSIREDNE